MITLTGKKVSEGIAIGKLSFFKRDTKEIRRIGSLTVEQSQKSFRPYKACIFLSNFACGYCVILRDVL